VTVYRRDVMWQTVPDSRGGDRESSVAVRRQPTTRDGDEAERRRCRLSSLDVCRPAEVVGEVRRRYTLQTLVEEKGELIVNPLRCLVCFHKI